MTVKAREKEIVCKVRTQQAENFDEEVKSLDDQEDDRKDQGRENPLGNK